MFEIDRTLFIYTLFVLFPYLHVRRKTCGLCPICFFLGPLFVCLPYFTVLLLDCVRLIHSFPAGFLTRLRRIQLCPKILLHV
ncbi:hypothetical protein DFP73DRAFT_556554 [Morchella snyderi]|nr:hypothetical protein DFP73DRAFT_556554 [Morchella snyderi]